jgi:hypothetical protein
MDKKRVRKHCALRKKVDKIGARLGHTPQKSEKPCTKNRHLKVISSQSYEAG